MKIRNENAGDAEKTYEDFMKDHQRETEATIPEVMSKADFALNNDGTFEDLHRQIEELLLKLR
jgi:dephospho-CoA kinase